MKAHKHQCIHIGFSISLMLSMHMEGSNNYSTQDLCAFLSLCIIFVSTRATTGLMNELHTSNNGSLDGDFPETAALIFLVPDPL